MHTVAHSYVTRVILDEIRRTADSAEFTNQQAAIDLINGQGDLSTINQATQMMVLARGIIRQVKTLLAVLPPELAIKPNDLETLIWILEATRVGQLLHAVEMLDKTLVGDEFGAVLVRVGKELLDTKPKVEDTEEPFEEAVAKAGEH